MSRFLVEGDEAIADPKYAVRRLAVDK